MLSSFWVLLTPVSETSGSLPSSKNILSFLDGNGVRVVFGDVELYFNASNGGEITEYYDLHLDPQRQRNLVDITVGHYKNLLPLFASIFYCVPLDLPFSTGGDPNAMLQQIAYNSQYLVMQTSSRMMSTSGSIAVDVNGNPIYINSTWIIRSDNVVFVERTFYLRSYATIPLLWEWYPFYVTRIQGFDYNATFYMFNTTYAETFIVNRDNYPGFSGLPKFFNDTNHVFGVAVPFSNRSIEGDGTHNIIIIYKYDELMDVNEWKSDNFNQMVKSSAITETGPKHRFFNLFNVSTHTYRTMISFAHQPIDERNILDSAKYFAANSEQACLMRIQIITNREAYNYGDTYAVYGSGLSNYDVDRVTGRLTIENNRGEAIFARHFGPGNLSEGQTFNASLLSGTVSPSMQKGNYTITFQIFSLSGILIASDSKTVELI